MNPTGCGLLALALAACSSGVAAQTALPEQPLLESTLTADSLRDLPLNNSPFALLETFQPEVVADGFSSNGLNVASSTRVGGLLNSWTQTEFRIGDITVTDPYGGGVPLLLPVLPFWERLRILAGQAGADENAPGLSMALEPIRPGKRWSRTIEGSLSAAPLVSGGSGPAPPIDRVDGLLDGSAVASGPLTDRLGLAVGGSWRGLSHVAMTNTGTASEDAVSGIAHFVFAVSPRDEFHALGWVQRAATDSATDTGVHLQSTWARSGGTHASWRAFGGYTERSRTVRQVSTLVVDSLTSNPVSDLVDSGAGASRRWELGAQVAPVAARALPTVGVDVEGAQARLDPLAVGQVGELVDGVAARLWTFHPGIGADIRRLTTVAVYGDEHWTAGPLAFTAGLRFDSTHGSADGSAQDIGWATWLPRALLRWRIAETGGLSLAASYRRSAYQLPLKVLAVGDPAAPFADVATWNGTSAGSLIALIGPGTGGNAAFAQIDPQLRRPVTDEMVLSLESRPTRWLRLEATGIAKREQPLVELVDTGVPASAYATLQVSDPNFLPDSPVGMPLATAYNRPAGAYGLDRYLLTNRTGSPAEFWGTEIGIRVSTSNLDVLARAAVLTRTQGTAAAVGYLPTENDQDVLGSTFVDPNTDTSARGQLFQDRTHAAKVAGIFRFPWRVRLGFVARYQDGQPFARLIVVPGLTQGATPVRAFANGGSAFTYTGTLDVRLQKAFTAGASDVAVVLDVYNLPNLGNEVTEHVASGPLYRTPTASQPPRTAVLGLRVTF